MTSIALIGPGRHGTAIARLFARSGIDVHLYHHRQTKAQAAAALVRAAARDADVIVADSLAEAVDGQNVVALTTLWNAPQRAVLSALGDHLIGKVLLDVSNPLDVTPQGIIPARPREGSAGQFVATLLPQGARHAKAFSNLATAYIEEGAGDAAVLPFAADSAATAALVRPYLARTGWHPWLVGGIEISRDLEIGGRYNAVHGRHGRSRLDLEEMRRYSGPEAVLA
ncbi:NAD(P)-binding domain-containing protein [Agromyces sp. PvR057]|uniref:NAD(P)-binding domain-containing protein n=1 Tax=Agromyces sp. PvR057 TaxID=3156403 RepID=UPI000E26E700